MLGSMSGRRTILVVEDDEDLRRMYRAALMLAGFDVRESADGFRALHALDQKPAPSCIVLDLMLPVLSGQAVKHELASSAEMRDIPVLVVTGSDADVAHLGATLLLRKPVSPDQLVDAVERCLDAVRPAEY
jgi:CheY-like chemotaxis protein